MKATDIIIYYLAAMVGALHFKKSWGEYGLNIFLSLLVALLFAWFLPLDVFADFNQDFEKFKSNARHWAPIHCTTLSDPSYDQRLAATYYDAEKVYDYLSRLLPDLHDQMIACRNQAGLVYGGSYVRPNNGNVPGYWNFSQGLSLTDPPAVQMLSLNAAYARPTNEDIFNNTELSREVAYALTSYLSAEALGYGDNALRVSRLDASLNHLNLWTNHSSSVPFVRPFMQSLTAKGVIRNNETHPDSRILPAIKAAFDKTWNEMWVPASWAFRYTDRDVPSGGTEPSPDLNLLIAPVYAWLYAQTGEVGYRDKFDAIFFGGVNYAFLGNAKQFNQNYWNMEEAITNRNSGSPTPLPTPTPTATRTATPIPTNTPTPGITPTRTPTAIPTQVACPDCPPRCPEKVKNRANGKVMNFVGEASLCQYR